MAACALSCNPCMASSYGTVFSQDNSSTAYLEAHMVDANGQLSVPWRVQYRLYAHHTPTLFMVATSRLGNSDRPSLDGCSLALASWATSSMLTLAHNPRTRDSGNASVSSSNGVPVGTATNPDANDRGDLHGYVARKRRAAPTTTTTMTTTTTTTTTPPTTTTCEGNAAVTYFLSLHVPKRRSICVLRMQGICGQHTGSDSCPS